MLTSLLPLLESLGGSGAATSLGRGSSVGSTLGRLLSGGANDIEAFGSAQEFSGAMSQISNLTSNLAAAQEAMTQSRDEHERLRVKAVEDERLYGFRDPAEQQRMADLQQQQFLNDQQQQRDQQQMQGLQSRAAFTMDPAAQAQQAHRTMFRQAGALAVAGQTVQSHGPAFVNSLPGVAPTRELLSFGMGKDNAKVANSMVDTAVGGASNVVGGALQGAAMGSLAGPLGVGIGAIGGGLAAASVEIAKLPSRIVDWSEALLESQKSISRFSGIMAQAEAQRDVRKLLRDFASAQTTGASTADLSHSMDDLYDALRPLKDTITIVIAQELAMLVKGITQLTPVLVGLTAATAAMADFYTLFAFGFSEKLKKALAEVLKAENDRVLRALLSGLGATRAIKAFKAEDTTKPRQAPRR